MRVGHGAIYFGPCRGIDASPIEIRREYRGIGRHLDAIGAELAGHDLPAVVRAFEKMGFVRAAEYRDFVNDQEGRLHDLIVLQYRMSSSDDADY